ncbi:hypothetical protein [Massilia genomosp. 1]|uniref:Uncharacterized protein n=1 Tax=Massilia genomosp. 1 TaxID=2609280 RepID=A0ABX0MYT0_9BURK|nr:hypothetical protein [Massilia genomosp. 1]NHZ65563.1 hypothetical protein [Massilia genomosp. 1]
MPINGVCSVAKAVAGCWNIVILVRTSAGALPGHVVHLRQFIECGPHQPGRKGRAIGIYVVPAPTQN